MTVTSITETRGVTMIGTDDGDIIAVRSAHFARMPLKEGDEFDRKAYMKDMAYLQKNDCYEAALSLLDRSEKSAHDVKERLMKMGYVPRVASWAVEKLEKCGLIDDARYASRLAEAALAQGKGAYALKRKLMSKGMSGDVVDEALTGLDEEQQRAAAAKTAAGMARKYEKLPPREARQKLIQALVRRGFSWEAAGSACEDLFPEE